ncbi:transcription factor AP-4 [Agrilus planipennis]|uniref:Transcription factor AP-4 n=1 Tax=Agrilus planipennis TaxID=224129 RepID=A0A1W4XJY8_AGRPL|nr:transcription factor AP-4 [Agrilus planipennis]
MSSIVGGDRIVQEGNNKETSESQGKISSRASKDGDPPVANMEAEKRIRREIANSNERRRMQSINAGFQSLRSLLPHHEGEKLSKAAILQQTAEYIYSLEQEKTRLLSQNCQLKRLVNQQQHEVGELPPKKRKTDVILPTITETTEDCVDTMASESMNIMSVTVVEPSESASELRRQLDRERGIRVVLEEQIRQLQGELYQQQMYQITTTEETDDLGLQVVAADSLPPVGHTQTVVCSPVPSRSPSPEPIQEKRLPSVLEAAIKAEPKVEVERVPTTPQDESSSGRTLYGPNTSRQNLETIVEAIRHLEGDHMFAEEPQQRTQEAPLALTTNTRSSDHILRLDMNQYVDFHVTQQSVKVQQQSRPGVIVVKQAS